MPGRGGGWAVPSGEGDPGLRPHWEREEQVPGVWSGELGAPAATEEKFGRSPCQLLPVKMRNC